MQMLYCNRCQKYHKNIPVDTNQIVKKHAIDMANHIDKEILNEIKMGRRPI